MSTLSVTALFAVQTAAEILETGLALARIVGLPVTSWRSGDPTRSLYKYLAEVLAAREGLMSDYIRAGFLSAAVARAKETGDLSWLRIVAWESYGVRVAEAGYATPSVTITNTGGGHYELDAGDLTFQSSATQKTFHTTSGGTLGAGDTLTLTLEADEAGSDSSVATDEIDTLVTPLLGVEIVSSTAATAADEPSPDAIQEQCDASLGALSPNGPRDAYEYVCRNAELTGVNDITRAKSVGDSDTGDVIVYVAGPSGPVAGASVTAAQAAIEAWAAPLCITPTVANTTAVAQDITAEIEGTDIPGDFESEIESALSTFLAALPIGGTVARSALIATIHNKLAALGASDVIITLTAPAANATLDAGQVATLGTVTITEV